MRQKYWNNTEILKHTPDYAIILGGRNLGKSYATKSYCLRKSWKEKSPTFVLIRRFDLETKPSHIENYFADTPVTEITDGKYNTIIAKAGTIYFATYDIETGKAKAGIPCGKYVALSGASHVKSESFPNVTDMIFEEFVANEYLGENEPDLLLHLVSTVARSRHVTVWLIGNTVNRMNPYVKKWDLHSLAKQPQNSIVDYNFNTTDGDGNPATVRISVEYCDSRGAGNSMFFGHASKAINGGAWECNEHPRLSLPIECYTLIYEVLATYNNFSFVVQLLTNDETGQRLLYAYPYTNKKTIDRVLTTAYSENPLHTVWFDTTREIEKVFIDLLNANQIAFSDNLTGDECIQALKGLKKTTL